MSLSLLSYVPTTQNHRVMDFGMPERNEDTPRPYRIEDATSPQDMDALIWAAYRQVYSEHVILASSRQKTLESQLKNRAITVRDFVRGLALSEPFYRLVVETNNNYRLVEVCLKRLLGRAPYNKDEEIAWSIRIGTQGFRGFVDELINSTEYEAAFGDSTVPYQRRRMEGRPFNLVTPRYGSDHRAKLGLGMLDWQFTMLRFYEKQGTSRRLSQAKAGDPILYRQLARTVTPSPMAGQTISVADLDFAAKVPYRGRR